MDAVRKHSCIMKVRTFRVGLCNNQLLLFPQDQRAQEISVACLLFLEMTAALWQLLCNTCLILFKMLGCCFMDVLWFSGARAFLHDFLPFLKLLIPILTLGASPLVPFGSCDGASIFLCASIGMGLEEKGEPTKVPYAPCVKITSMACAGLCLGGSGLLGMETWLNTVLWLEG